MRRAVYPIAFNPDAIPRGDAPGNSVARRVDRPRQQARSRRYRAGERLLLIHAGWVGMALIMVSYIPVWRADHPPRRSSAIPAAPPVRSEAKPQSALPELTSRDRRVLFAGGSESLVARTVGHAEGTRTPDGHRTRAYYGHVDPGNRAWNLGSFSFQHCKEPRYSCTTPEQADVFQLQRLEGQAAIVQQQVRTLGFQMTLEEELNSIDLANQAPLAAISTPGYADRLLQAKQKGFKGQDAILEARVWSYWNPQTNRWDAPGLGNSEPSIRHDQERRLLAIARALTVYQQQATAPANGSASRNQLNVQAATSNPYAFEQQHSQYLWWDAGFWDAKLKQQRQVPSGYEPAYDAGFTSGMAP